MPFAESAPGDDDGAVSIDLAMNSTCYETEESDEIVPSLSFGPDDDSEEASVVSAFDFEGFTETETK